MKSQDIRDSFTRFFVERQHLSVASSPLVPQGDPTLLFTNAGMVPFKDFFLGAATPPAPRAVSVQKCLRVSGKHNDLENVGPSPRHHTFFEMLGNFSFGDYFKEEAIDFGWDLVTRVWGLPPAHLFASVYEEDDEAEELWRRISSLPHERIRRCGAKDNFWAMGETGPCGPCSEIFVDVTPDQPPVSWEEGTESGRYLEIWNLVFMQFNRGEDGVMVPLPNPSIDTGAGLERVAAVLQGVSSNYDTDLFQPVLHRAAELAGTEYGADDQADVSFRVIADHVRATAFLLADGVIPANDGRGYVLRRLLRRAVRHGMLLGFEEPFLHRLLPAVREAMGAQYPELESTERASTSSVRAEEEKFLTTVAAASRQVQATIDETRKRGSSVLPGGEVFRLYDTYGLPLEIVREIAEEERFALDEEGFERALDEQRRRSREAVSEGQRRLVAVRDALRVQVEGRATLFEGHGALRGERVEVSALARTEKGAAEAVAALESGEEGVVVLGRTPFYAESGGQLGDRGSLAWEGGRAAVLDAQKDASGVHYHFVRVTEGRLERGSVVAAEVDPQWRAPTQRNHTATHLLHLALRRVLGEDVRQAGSLVAPDRLRFDFTYSKPLTDDEIERIEDLVNRWILLARGTEITVDRSFDEAVAAGAMALFGEKYGARVRTVEIPGLPANGPGDAEELRSLELCGGCHVANTGEIGLFLITMERGVASGVRRIEAVTGEAARRQVREQKTLLEGLTSELGVPADRALQEIEGWRRKARRMEREMGRLRMLLVSGSSGTEAVEVGGVRVLAQEVPPAPPSEFRNMADVLRSRLGSGVVVLGSREEGKVSLVAAVSKDLEDRLHAGRLVRRLAELVGGSGGGRADFAQAGGKEPAGLPAALTKVEEIVREELGD